MKYGAGVFVRAEDTGRILLLLRTDGLWGFPGGHHEKGESLLETALRELVEETGYEGVLLVEDVPLVVFWSRSGRPLVPPSLEGASFVYLSFRATVPCEFAAVIDHEHEDYGWFDGCCLPEDLHTGVELALSASDTSAAPCG